MTLTEAAATGIKQHFNGQLVTVPSPTRAAKNQCLYIPLYASCTEFEDTTHRNVLLPLSASTPSSRCPWQHHQQQPWQNEDTILVVDSSSADRPWEVCKN